MPALIRLQRTGGKRVGTDGIGRESTRTDFEHKPENSEL